MGHITESYIIQGGVEGFDRLKLQSRVMHAGTCALLDRVGVRPGMRCLDVGCGSGDVTFELARRVGVQGHVVGVDLDEVQLALARREGSAPQLQQVEFRTANVCELKGAPEYDLIFIRLVLTHLRDPAATLAYLRPLLRPGGVMVVEDLLASACFCYPFNPSFERFLELYIKTGQRRGADPFIGPRLHALLASAGVSELQIAISQPVGAVGEIKLIAPLTMTTIAPAVIAEGYASADELERVVADLVAMAADTYSVMGMPPMFQVWGRSDPS